MALSATTQFEVRTTGSDSNGGGFDTSSSGTDFSQQDSPQIAYTDLVINATTNTKCTSAGNPFTSAHVGNIINITGGTGFTVQRVQVASVAAGVATCDKSLGTLSSTGGVGNLGGGMLTIQAALNASASNNTIWIKSGTYTLTTGLVKGTGGSTTMFLGGYASTHGDFGTAPLITTATNSTILISGNWTSGSNNMAIVNLSLSSTASVKADGIDVGGNFVNYVAVDRCIIDGVNYGVGCAAGIAGSTPAELTVRGCEIKNCVNSGVVSAAKMWVIDCYIHNNTGFGIRSAVTSASVTVIGNIIANNAGGAGLLLAGSEANVVVMDNTFVGTTGRGLGGPSLSTFVLILENNIFYGNSTYGAEPSTANYAPTIPVSNLNNAYGANTTAARHNLAVGTNDVTLTANPFTNSSAGDYSLNTTSGGGAACRLAGFPGVFAGGTSTGSLDIGAVQSSGGGGGGGGGGGSYTFLG